MVHLRHDQQKCGVDGAAVGSGAVFRGSRRSGWHSSGSRGTDSRSASSRKPASCRPDPPSSSSAADGFCGAGEPGRHKSVRFRSGTRKPSSAASARGFSRASGVFACSNPVSASKAGYAADSRSLQFSRAAARRALATNRLPAASHHHCHRGTGARACSMALAGTHLMGRGTAAGPLGICGYHAGSFYFEED